MQEATSQLVVFIIVSICLILVMGAFILSILLLYRKKQIKNDQILRDLKNEFEKDLLKAELEIQEHTFQEISREIHDNINLSLTLVKLNLNTLQTNHKEELKNPIESIGKVIDDLTDLSRSMNSEIIEECGLITALKMELMRINRMNQLDLHMSVTGSPVFLDSKKELYVFRIIQEAFNNILKHSKATTAQISLWYKEDYLQVDIHDNGQGIHLSQSSSNENAFPSSGLKGMHRRVEFLKGKMNISSKPYSGTHLKISLPILKAI